MSTVGREPQARSPRAPDHRHPGLEFPWWVPWLTLAIVVSVAAAASLPHRGVGLHPLALALVWLSIVPWVLDAADLVVHRLLFGSLVLGPQAVLHVGGAALGIADLGDESPSHLAVAIVVFTVGEVAATAGWRTSLAVAAAAAAIIAGRGLVEPRFDVGLLWTGGVVIALAIGFMMRRQAETTFQLRAAQDALAREAVARERHRIAREVHDVIAHSLTVTMLHLTAARMAVRRDPGGAESTLREAERHGRQSLADVRRTVGLLRDEPPPTVERPQPDLRDLRQLIDHDRAAGIDVTAELDEGLRDLPPSAGLAVYRIVQESLTNAGKHAAGASVHVSARVVDGHVDLRVRSGAGRAPPARARTGGGVGIVGMRERAALLGGTLEAGPHGGGWLVRCRFPLHGVEPAGAARSEPDGAPP